MTTCKMPPEQKHRALVFVDFDLDQLEMADRHGIARSAGSHWTCQISAIWIWFNLILISLLCIYFILIQIISHFASTGTIWMCCFFLSQFFCTTHWVPGILYGLRLKSMLAASRIFPSHKCCRYLSCTTNRACFATSQ